MINDMLQQILAAVPGSSPSAIMVTGEGSLPSVFPVIELATASVGAAGLAVSELLGIAHGRQPAVTVDRRSASMWFGSSLRPDGWAPPPPWDPIAGDYLAADGWIRLHTNAPAHREAALRVLGTPAEREHVTEAVAARDADELEAAVIEAGGCAAAMHSLDEWRQSEAGRRIAAEPLIRWEATGISEPLRLPLDPIRPLAGLRVLDLTRVLAGPVATRFLALLGADVLRIDPPWWDEPGVVPDVMLGKRSARLDLRDGDQRVRFLTLLAACDVLVHGYRPGALDSLGLGESVRRRGRPGLIEVVLDAYGWTGPWSSRRGFDSLVQMSTGIADAGMRQLSRDKPTPLPVQALDHATGYIMAHAAIRAVTTQLTIGRSCRASVSLARTAHLLTGYDVGEPSLPLAAEGAHDIEDAIEHTSWGPAHRLTPPLKITGVEIRAGMPARDLGLDPAQWHPRVV